MGRIVTQLSSTIVNPYTGADWGGSTAWTNPENTRDHDPPILDGTDTTFASAQVTTVDRVKTCKITSKTVPAGAYWAAAMVDWEIVSWGTGNEYMTLFVKNGGFWVQLASATANDGLPLRRRGYGVITDTLPIRVVTSTAVDVILSVAIGTGTVLSVKVYEIGLFHVPRGEMTVQNG